MTPNNDPLRVGDEVQLHHRQGNLGRFRILSIRDDGAYTAEQYNESNGKWHRGHVFGNYDTFKWVLLNRIDFPKDDGCVCMRCNSRNKWAAPNRPNGKYLCYECR